MSSAAPPAPIFVPSTISKSSESFETGLSSVIERRPLDPYILSGSESRELNILDRVVEIDGKRGNNLPRANLELDSLMNYRVTPASLRDRQGIPESAVERPRVTRAAAAATFVGRKDRKRTKADSPREQRRKGRNKERRGQNWCPDADIGNRAFLAPTVFEGKARSMSSARKPGSNYAVTFEVKQVYKSQPGFQPLVKNDSVRLHFRDKVPGKSTMCAGSDSGQEDGQAGFVRANIKRGKVYLVFVSRVGPRNFTILGEPMIRSKKNAQAVQAVVRPDYGKSKLNPPFYNFPPKKKNDIYERGRYID